jgi:predicted DNA-binding transcriptional regulator AlpA
MRPLTADQVAAEFGRSKDWLYDNHARLAREQKMPKPLHDGGELAWDPAQFYAWKDRGLPKELRAAAAAYRAAFAAYAGHDAKADDEETEIARWKHGLDTRYAKGN